MMLRKLALEPAHLIEVATKLLESQRRKPKQAFLRRAVSSCYYAVFHALAHNAADCLVGKTPDIRSGEAWKQVYRALEHGFAKKQCRAPHISSFPNEIQEFAALFTTLQTKRHKADYDPSERLSKSAVKNDVQQAKLALAAFQRVPVTAKREFAVFVLMKIRAD
jgi:uncharacterized protein (UPF0332 family)